jgi:hypothetical protein
MRPRADRTGTARVLVPRTLALQPVRSRTSEGPRRDESRSARSVAYRTCPGPGGGGAAPPPDPPLQQPTQDTGPTLCPLSRQTLLIRPGVPIRTPWGLQPPNPPGRNGPHTSNPPLRAEGAGFSILGNCVDTTTDPPYVVGVPGLLPRSPQVDLRGFRLTICPLCHRHHDDEPSAGRARVCIKCFGGPPAATKIVKPRRRPSPHARTPAPPPEPPPKTE